MTENPEQRSQDFQDGVRSGMFRMREVIEEVLLVPENLEISREVLTRALVDAMDEVDGGW